MAHQYFSSTRLGASILYYLLPLCLGIFSITSCNEPPIEPDPIDSEIIKSSVVVIDSTELKLISTPDEIAEGLYRFTFTGSAPDVSNGDIIIGDEGPGFLRTVESDTVSGNTITLKTESANMEDVFEDADFSFFVPVDSSTGKNEASTLRYEIDQYPLYSQNGISIIADGFVELAMDLEFDFEFSGGSLSHMIFKTKDAVVVSELSLNASAEQAIQLLDKTDTLASHTKYYTHWVLGGPVPVPVVIELRTSMLLNYGATISSQVAFGTQVSSQHSFEVGTEYSEGSWTGIYSLTPSNSISPAPLNGRVGSTIRADLTPIIEVKLYGIAGPYASISLKELLSGNVASPSFNWDFSIDAWLRSTVGISGSVLGKSLGDYNTFWESEKLRYETPYELQKIEGDNQTGIPGDYLSDPIGVKVKDQFGNPQSNVPVRFFILSGGGKVSSSVEFTDDEGIAEVNWEPGAQGLQKLSAEIKNSQNQHIQLSPVEFTAFVDPINCETKPLDFTYVLNGRNLDIIPTGGFPPYSYTVDGTNFQSGFSFRRLFDGTYQLQVVDSLGCATDLESVTISECLNSDLEVNADFSLTDLSIAANGGTEPYNYGLREYIDTTFLPWQSGSYFPDLDPGTYVCRAIDSFQCTSVKYISVGPCQDVALGNQNPVFNLTSSGNPVDTFFCNLSGYFPVRSVIWSLNISPAKDFECWNEYLNDVILVKKWLRPDSAGSYHVVSTGTLLPSAILGLQYNPPGTNINHQFFSGYFTQGISYQKVASTMQMTSGTGQAIFYLERGSDGTILSNILTLTFPFAPWPC